MQMSYGKSIDQLALEGDEMQNQLTEILTESNRKQIIANEYLARVLAAQFQRDWEITPRSEKVLFGIAAMLLIGALFCIKDPLL